MLRCAYAKRADSVKTSYRVESVSACTDLRPNPGKIWSSALCSVATQSFANMHDQIMLANVGQCCELALMGELRFQKTHTVRELLQGWEGVF